MTIVLYGEARKPDIYYRCKWSSDAPCIYVETADERVLYVPGFECARAKQEVVSSVQVKKLSDAQKVLSSLQGPFVVDRAFPHRLAKHLKGAVEVCTAVFSARTKKTDHEVSLLREAQEVAKKAMDLVESQLREAHVIDGVVHLGGDVLTSEQLKMLVRTFLIQQGADCPDVIVSSGSQTALPHHRGSGPLVEGPIIVDIFPHTSNGYCGDLTRTFLLGSDPRAQELLAAVREVQELCIAKCVPEQNIDELHVFAQEELSKRGFDTDGVREQGFIHSLGHGIGLAVHELPMVGPRAGGVLEEGMVVTIEPGLYYEIGVRWEDVVVVGEQPRVL